MKGERDYYKALGNTGSMHTSIPSIAASDEGKVVAVDDRDVKDDDVTLDKKQATVSPLPVMTATSLPLHIQEVINGYLRTIDGLQTIIKETEEKEKERAGGRTRGMSEGDTHVKSSFNDSGRESWTSHDDNEVDTLPAVTLEVGEPMALTEVHGDISAREKDLTLSVNELQGKFKKLLPGRHALISRINLVTCSDHQ